MLQGIPGESSRVCAASGPAPESEHQDPLRVVSGEGRQMRALALGGVRTLLPGSPAPPLQAKSPLPLMAAAATQIILAASAAVA